MNDTSRDDLKPPRGRLLRLLPLLVLGLGLVAFLVLDGGRYGSVERLAAIQGDLRAWVADHPGLAPLAYMGVYALVIALCLPIGSYATLLGGFLFGPFLGTLWAALAATTGASLLFLAARTALGDILRKRAGPGIKRMEAGFREDAFSYLLALRLTPVFPFALVNLVPAFFNIPLRTYMAATVIGILPATFVYAGIGHGLAALLEDGRTPDLTVIAKPEILLPLLGLALLALLPVLWKKLKARRADG